MESHFTRNAAKSEDYRKEEYKKRGTRNMSETFLPANILMPQVDSMKKLSLIHISEPTRP